MVVSVVVATQLVKETEVEQVTIKKSTKMVWHANSVEKLANELIVSTLVQLKRGLEESKKQDTKIRIRTSTTTFKTNEMKIGTLVNNQQTRRDIFITNQMTTLDWKGNHL